MCAHTSKDTYNEGMGNPSRIWNIMKKIGEFNRKLEKINRTISQTLTPRPEHDKIQAWWASNIPSKNMLERVWWCKHSEMESWNWTICWLMSCLNKRGYERIGGGRRSHATLKCCWKRKLLLLTCVKASKRKGRWSTINLETMIEATKANSLNRLLRQWWSSIWTQSHQNLLGKRLVYRLEVFLGC